MAAKPGSAPPLNGVEQALMDVLLPVLSDDGLVVEELRLIPAGRRRVLKVLVDRDPYAGPPGSPPPAADAPIEGLSLDEVAEASRAVGDRLDRLTAAEDPLEGLPYTLEVSSPGVDRPLTLPRHFRRNVGRLVDLRTTHGATLRGRICAVTPATVTVETDEGTRELGWDDVVSAAVQVEFRRPPRSSGRDSGDQEG